MEWQVILGSWVLLPPQPLGVIHFLGGAFIGTSPQLLYRSLLEKLGEAGFAVIATPFLNGFDHQALARQVLNRFDYLYERLQKEQVLGSASLPIYGIGHSLGCKLHLLIGSLYEVRRSGNILIAFNNYPVRRAIPLADVIEDTSGVTTEFEPSPEETRELIAQNYGIRRNLLIRFRNDELDQNHVLEPLLQAKFTGMVSLCRLPGNHLTPLGQDLRWQPGASFTPLDALGQWVNQAFSANLQQLTQEMLRWLNPTG